MLRLTLRKLAVGPYALFMIEQKKNPKLVGLPVPKRGKVTSRLYKALSDSERAALERRAAKHPAFKHKSSKLKKARGPRKPSMFALYVKKHYHDAPFQKLNGQQKIRAIAKLWQVQKASGVRPVVAKSAPARKKVKAAAPAKLAKTSKSRKAVAPLRKKTKAAKTKVTIKKKSAHAAPLKLKLSPKRTGKTARKKMGKKTTHKSRSLVKGGMLII